MSKVRKTAIKNLKGSDEELRVDWMIRNMSKNKTFLYFSSNMNQNEKDTLLEKFKKNYLEYRKKWRENLKIAIKNNSAGKDFNDSEITPQCIDIEVASVCDLACPHCYRQFISTPDKIMTKELAFRLIDQASEMKVPSMKFNWRGEPLLNPALPEIINYAKKKGVLETIINTNATKLDSNMSNKIIDSGLDLMIYSFDGGTKKSYEKMRPGRFKENKFDDIYKNIKNFNKIRKERKSSFPRTKIQMVLTNETFNEQGEYFSLFRDIVDDVSVKQYTERGGRFGDIDQKYLRGACSDENLDSLNKKIDNSNFNKNSEVMKDPKGNIFVSKGRLPCEQPYQRMLVTYDGRVSMCCYDWGSMHPVGYADQLAIDMGEKEYEKVKKKADMNEKGFDLMNLKMPEVFNEPKKKVKSIKEIWFGEEINHVRKKHSENALEDVKICKGCPFKETYDWVKLN